MKNKMPKLCLRVCTVGVLSGSNLLRRIKHWCSLSSITSNLLITFSLDEYTLRISIFLLPWSHFNSSKNPFLCQKFIKIFFLESLYQNFFLLCLTFEALLLGIDLNNFDLCSSVSANFNIYSFSYLPYLFKIWAIVSLHNFLFFLL